VLNATKQLGKDVECISPALSKELRFVTDVQDGKPVVAVSLPLAAKPLLVLLWAPTTSMRIFQSHASLAKCLKCATTFIKAFVCFLRSPVILLAYFKKKLYMLILST
jgi:hypothetical protein